MSTRRASQVTPNAQYGIHKFGYILGKTLGSGAYAKVKTATSLKSSMCRGEVAVKIIDKKSAPKDVVAKFLPREIETLKAIDHENVIKLYDVVDTTDTIYLVLELATSGDLLDFINSRRYLSERMAKAFFTDLVAGIKVCHDMNIVHRDLKCENLLLDARLRLKISDFGFARRIDGQNLETYCGSYAYAAPEVILGQPYIGQCADIWSMGVILFAMLAGKLPFKDSDVRTLLAEISSVLVYPTRLGSEVKQLITRMLTFAPHERITVSEISTHPWMNTVGDQTAKDGKKPSSPPKDTKTAPTKDSPPKQGPEPARTVAIPNSSPKKQEKASGKESQKQGTSGKEQVKTITTPAKDSSPKGQEKTSGKESVKTETTKRATDPKAINQAAPKAPERGSSSAPRGPAAKTTPDPQPGAPPATAV